MKSIGARSPSPALGAQAPAAPSCPDQRRRRLHIAERARPSLSYAVITPVRDEAAYISRLAAALAGQVTPPAFWVIVDNGSTDTTPAVVDAFARELPWVVVRTTEGAAEAARGAPVVRAFHLGLEALPGAVDVIVKLDADVSVAADFADDLLERFESDPGLGIVGGTCYEQNAEGDWRAKLASGLGVRGACRAYRAACLRSMLPLEERLGWDTIDVATAVVWGWRIRVCDDLPFLHHRAEAAREQSGRARWTAQGAAAHYMGYRPFYLLARALYRAGRSPSAVWLVGGYFGSALRREPRLRHKDIVRFLRRQQSLHRLPRLIARRLRRTNPIRNAGELPS